MTYKGHIKNGVVVLDEPVSLPEGAEVEVAVRTPDDRSMTEVAVSATSERPMTLYERFADLIDACPDLPADMAENHDHYIHRREKK